MGVVETLRIWANLEKQLVVRTSLILFKDSISIIYPSLSLLSLLFLSLMPRSASRRNASTPVTTAMAKNTKPPASDTDPLSHSAHTRQELNSTKPVQQSEPQRGRHAAEKPVARHSNEISAPLTTATTSTATATTTSVSMGVTSTRRNADVSNCPYGS